MCRNSTEQSRNIYGVNRQTVQYSEHKNGKWYAVIMTVEKSKLGLEGKESVDIMDVKCDPDMTNLIIQTHGFLPGYHMNKQHWITILLDGSVSKAKILDFLDMSYDLIDGAGRKENK